MKTLLIGLLMCLFPVAENAIVNDIQSQAKDKNKKIAIYFSGSDWCANCHQFSKSILENKEIDHLLDNEFVFYTADFPQRKKLDAATKAANELLAEKLNPKGEFPVLVITDNDLKVITRIYKGHAQAAVLQKLKDVQNAD